MDWSGMLPELLAIIAQKHIAFYEDYYSFASVCKSWHLAAIQAAKHPQDTTASIYDKVFMTSCGWLVTVEEDFSSQLINPLSCETINLLKLPLVVVSWGWARHLGFCQPGDSKKDQTVVKISMVLKDFYEGMRSVTYLVRVDDGERKRLLVLVREGKHGKVEKGGFSMVAVRFHGKNMSLANKGDRIHVLYQQ
ncbi:hypothetical protein Tco_0529035 [Tanacetum coccineum]